MFNVLLINACNYHIYPNYKMTPFHILPLSEKYIHKIHSALWVFRHF